MHLLKNCFRTGFQFNEVIYSTKVDGENALRGKSVAENIRDCNSGVQRSGDALFVTSQYDIIFRFGTNVLAKFVDTTCIFSGAEAVLGQG